MAQVAQHAVLTEGNGVPSSKKYILPTDEEERERLDIQHGLLKKLYGGLLPSKYTPSGDDEILDSGTGTGIWALDLASTSPPTVHFTGIDITPTLFPAHPPPNLAFLRQSVLELPESWSSRFALVHQRLLSGAFGLTEWNAVLPSFFRVLKPGGWVRLEEFSTEFVPPLDEVRTPKSLRMMSTMTELARRSDLMLTPRVLPGLLEEAGFREVEVQDVIWPFGPGDEHERARMNIAILMRRLTPPLKAIMNVSEDEVNDLIEGFLHEMATNDIGMRWLSFSARKPLSS